MGFRIQTLTLSFFFFLVALEFELRTSCVLCVLFREMTNSSVCVGVTYELISHCAIHQGSYSAGHIAQW
jgi:hypothetical protein